MSTIQDQVKQNTISIQTLLDAAKTLNQLPALAAALNSNDLFMCRLDSTGITVKVDYATLLQNAGGVKYKGAYDAATNIPDLDVSPVAIGIGFMYTTTVAGTFFTKGLEIGDVIISEKINPTVEADWTIIQGNITIVDFLSKAVYDPIAIAGDVFDMANMVESSSEKILTNAERIILSNTSNVNTGDEVDATTTVKGIVELATSSETGGANPNLVVTPLGLLTWLKDSSFGTKEIHIHSFDSNLAVSIGDGVIGYTVPASMDGYNIVNVVCSNHSAGGSGTIDVQVRRRRAGVDIDVLSTKVTISTSEQFAEDGIINVSNDDVNTGDIIYIDVDATQGLGVKGLDTIIELKLP